MLIYIIMKKVLFLLAICGIMVACGGNDSASTKGPKVSKTVVEGCYEIPAQDLKWTTETEWSDYSDEPRTVVELYLNVSCIAEPEVPSYLKMDLVDKDGFVVFEMGIADVPAAGQKLQVKFKEREYRKYAHEVDEILKQVTSAKFSLVPKTK